MHLKHRPGERASGREAGLLVVLGGAFRCYDLSLLRNVLPCDLSGSAVFKVDRPYRIGWRVAGGGFQFADFVFPFLQALPDIDVPVLIRFVLADGTVALIIEQEGHAVDAIFRDAVYFADYNAGSFAVGNGQRRVRAGLDFDVVRRGTANSTFGIPSSKKYKFVDF